MSAIRKTRWSRLTGLWCAMMHGDTTWPIHGHYLCRKCRREYAIPW